jgi:nucleotidyltransferase/DNA polymerase involved in DNA repair
MLPDIFVVEEGVACFNRQPAFAVHRVAGIDREVQNRILQVKFNDFEIITRSRSVPSAVSSRYDLEALSIGILQNEMPLPRPVRLLGISLSSLQGDEQEPQLSLPI